MNIFALSETPKIAAQYHCDKHVVKMPLETAQLLCTAHRILDGKMIVEKNSNGRRMKRWILDNPSTDSVLYKATHINHPSAIWGRETSENYNWLYSLFVELCKEYTHRYGKIHLCETKLKDVLKQPPKNIKIGALTEIPQCMPDYCKRENFVEGYKAYYVNEKTKMLVYKNREIPSWIK